VVAERACTHFGCSYEDHLVIRGKHSPARPRVEYGQPIPERDALVALLLAPFSPPVARANRLLLLAGYAPLHHKALARTLPKSA